jgi:hypothetical protein
MRRLAQNAAGYAVSVVDATLPYPDLIPGRADAWAWLVVAVAGLGAGLVAAWRRWQPVVIYLLLYAALLLYWPWPVDRFLEPVALLAAPLWLLGLLTLSRRALTRGWMVPVLVAGGIVATTSAWISAGQARRQVECRRGPALPGPGRCLYPAQQDFLAATVWLRDSSAADARVLTVKPGDSYWYARREAVSFDAATSRSAAPLSQYLRAEHVSYVVLTTVTGSERTRLAELLAGACGDLSVAATVAPQAYVLRVRGAAEADSTNACAAVADYRSAVADSLRSKRWQ